MGPPLPGATRRLGVAAIRLSILRYTPARGRCQPYAPASEDRETPLPLFTELPRRGVLGNQATSTKRPRKLSGKRILCEAWGRSPRGGPRTLQDSGIDFQEDDRAAGRLPDVKALVAGAGPAGAATALLLARCGLDVAPVAREAAFGRGFRGG